MLQTTSLYHLTKATERKIRIDQILHSQYIIRVKDGNIQFEVSL